MAVQLDALLHQAEGFADFAMGEPSSGASVVDAIAALEAAELASGATRILDPAAQVLEP